MLLDKACNVELRRVDLLILFLAICALALSEVKAQEGPQLQARNPNRVDHAMYFHSKVRDASGCSMEVQGGEIVFAEGISNPAMTCPDMFSWKLFTDAVGGEFWHQWANEAQNWPEEPYRLCIAGEKPEKEGCCRLRDSRNDKVHCPQYPGDAKGTKGDASTPVLQPSLREHASVAGFEDLVRFSEDLSEQDQEVPKEPCSSYPLPDHYESLGRVLRNVQGGLNVRNRAFHEYLFENNLYNADGVLDVFWAQHQNQSDRSPYHLKLPEHERMVGNSSPGATVLSRIEFPSDAIMIKSNWVNAELLERIGKKYGWDPYYQGNHYVAKKMENTLKIREHQGPGGGVKETYYNCNGKHYLVAFHISSKDIPNWIWTTFEHANLPGRCDITGCNDSWGSFSSDPDIPVQSAQNYVRPKTKPKHPDLFLRDQIYDAEELTPRNEQVLDLLGIGTGLQDTKDPKENPTPEDPAWRSYRLKGSQVEYVDSMGLATFLGNSVTEGGFMDGSSCITCHARAGADQFGPPLSKSRPDGAPKLPLGVFMNELTSFGYGKSASGVPNPSWFYDSNESPRLRVMQTDFVWGFMRAYPLVEKKP